MSAEVKSSVSTVLSEALTALDAGEVTAARELAVRAGELCGDSFALANTALVRGYVEQTAGEMEYALDRFEYARALAERHCDTPEGISLRVHATTSAATIHRLRGWYAEAERLLLTALDRVEAAADAEDVVTLCNELGVVLKYSGKFDAAAGFYGKALGLLSGANSLELATIHHNIAGLAHARGDHAAAEGPARRAVAVRTDVLGPDHPDVAADCAALAPILLELGAAEEAESLLRRAVEIFESTFGAEHYEVGISVGNLAAVMHQAGRTAEAESHYRRSLSILESVLGTRHPELAPVLYNFAQMIVEADPDGAREALERARVSLVSAHVEESHPTLVSINSSLDELKAEEFDGNHVGES
ncbi:tetratricopeptide repeat protein [Streptomyces sp. ODS05-4]|uniref:tetratricopeptide repeat protein n=1 Tax=Streptomyces sp. ODS05-4 TaxID=2944939 RepID=UPI00210E3A9A|nr:tetratricopeptide repeat protein [Streptomyces sp. ODS05-4]